jgi:hypothetical protein
MLGTIPTEAKMSNSVEKTQVCHTCGQEKVLSLFPKWRLKCRACKSAENSARLKERYATDPKFIARTKERAATWQRENAERANEYHRRRHEKKVATGDREYLTKQAAASAKYNQSEKGKAVTAARMKQYEESGQDKAWRSARYARPESRAAVLLHGARNRAAKNGMECTVIFDQIYTALIAGTCPKTKLPFDLSPHADLRRHPLAPSIDRIDSLKGYTPDNVQVVCNWYNLAKHELSETEMLAFCRAVVDNAPKPDV